MSGFYIHGMEMPTFRDDYVAIVIYGNGTIRSVHGYVIDGATAIPVPPHGDLIDRDVLMHDTDSFVHKTMLFGGQYVYSEDAIKNAPTIIPASDKEAKE